MNDGMRSTVKLLREKGMGIKQLAHALHDWCEDGVFGGSDYSICLMITSNSIEPGGNGYRWIYNSFYPNPSLSNPCKIFLQKTPIQLAG